MRLEEAKLIVLGALATGAIWFFLTPLVFALVVAVLVYPAYKRLAEHVNHSVAALATTASVLFLILYPLVWAIRSLAGSARLLVPTLASKIAALTSPLTRYGFSLNQELYAAGTAKLVEALTSFVLSAPEIFIKFFVFIVLLFYLIRDGQQLKTYVTKLAKNEKQAKALKAAENLFEAVILGYVGMAILIGIVAWGGFLLLGYPHAFLIGGVVGIGALLPIIGPWLVYLPLAAWEYMQGDYTMMGAVLAFGLFLQFLEVYVAPKITAKKAHVHPAIMLLGFLGGAAFLGLKGIILGPLILGSLKVVIDHYE